MPLQSLTQAYRQAQRVRDRNDILFLFANKKRYNGGPDGFCNEMEKTGTPK